MIKTMFRTMTNIFENFCAMLCGFLMSILGYFLPVKDIVHLLILFFILDVIFGYWAARKLKKERFSVKIIWKHTMPRMLLSIILVLGAFMWDDVFKQDLVSTYKIVGWFIAGVLLFSIAENGYLITRWEIFPKIRQLIGKRIQDNTGIDIDPEDDNSNKIDNGKE